jgi:CDP-6-deoxy-D-xylo-4-hexulose-3-dehydrase
VYTHFGYNLKVTEMQAAVGCAQLEKLPLFTEERRKNWKMILKGLKGLEDIFILPEETSNSDPSWFGFLLTVRENTGVSRKAIVDFLEGRQIQTRMLFAGNMTRHPCFDEMRAENKGYRVVGTLNNTDIIMSNTFWVGVYPGLTKEEIKFVINSIKESVRVITK